VGRDGSATIHLAPLSVRVFDVGSAQGAQAKPAAKKGVKRAVKAGAKGSWATKAAKVARPTNGAEAQKS
jgi:hypothetical protein